MKIHQQEHWNKVLDARNIRENRALSQGEIESELQFNLTPDKQYALSLMGDLKGKKVLEIGGGLGINAISLARAGADVFVIDIANARLELLQKISSNLNLEGRIHLFQMQGESLGFKENFFDIAYTKSVLIHTEVKRVAKEVKRTLKDGGIGIFIEPFTKNPFANFYRRTFAPKIWREIAHYFDLEQLAKISLHFQNIEVKRFYLFSFLAFFWQFGIRNLTLFKLSIKILTYFDNILFKIFPFLRKYAWFGVIFVKK